MLTAILREPGLAGCMFYFLPLSFCNKTYKIIGKAFVQAGYHSCHTTDRVQALKARKCKRMKKDMQ